VIPADHTASTGNEADQVQLLTDHLSVLSALRASNHDSQRHLIPPISAQDHSSASTPVLVVSSKGGSNDDYRVMDKLLGREQTASVQGKVIQYSPAPPGISSTQMYSAPPNMYFAPPDPVRVLDPTTTIADKVTTAAALVPDTTAVVPTKRTSAYRGHGSPTMDGKRDDDQAADDHRQNTLTLDESDLQLDEPDEYEYSDEQSAADSDDNLHESATGNVLSHRANDGSARDSRVVASPNAPSPAMNAYMTALYAHSLGDRRPETSQPTHTTRMQLTRVRNRKVHLAARRQSADDRHAPVVKRQHKSTKLVNKAIPSKSRSAVSSDQPATPHYNIASLSSRSAITAAAVKKIATNIPIISPAIKKNLSRSHLSNTSTKSNTSPPSTRGRMSPSLYSNTASSASKNKVAVNSSLDSISFEQQPTKKEKPDKRLVKVGELLVRLIMPQMSVS